MILMCSVQSCGVFGAEKGWVAMVLSFCLRAAREVFNMRVRILIILVLGIIAGVSIVRTGRYRRLYTNREFPARWQHIDDIHFRRTPLVDAIHQIHLKSGVDLEVNWGRFGRTRIRAWVWRRRSRCTCTIVRCRIAWMRWLM